MVQSTVQTFQYYGKINNYWKLLSITTLLFTMVRSLNFSGCHLRRIWV
jgi:hypothetical protein